MYNVSYDSGILVVAFPNQYVDTKLEFSYWIAEDMTELPVDYLWIIYTSLGVVVGLFIVVKMYKEGLK